MKIRLFTVFLALSCMFLACGKDKNAENTSTDLSQNTAHADQKDGNAVADNEQPANVNKPNKFVLTEKSLDLVGRWKVLSINKELVKVDAGLELNSDGTCRQQRDKNGLPGNWSTSPDDKTLTISLADGSQEVMEIVELDAKKLIFKKKEKVFVLEKMN